MRLQLPEHVVATLHLMRGRREQAMDAFRRILTTEPADPSALPMVLDDLRQRSQVNEAIPIAERALVAMPDNFFALDALAWARIQRGEHTQAKDAIDKAVVSLSDLGVERPFKRPARLMLRIVLMLARLPLLLKGQSRVPSVHAIETGSAEWVARWRAWAQSYLEWYEHEQNPQRGAGRPTSGCS